MCIRDRLNDRCNSRGYLFGLQDVGDDRVEIGGVLANGVEALLVARDDDHLGAGGNKMVGHFKAQSVRAAGNCDDFVLPVAHVRVQGESVLQVKQLLNGNPTR